MLVGLQTHKSGNQENNAAVFDHCNLTNMQVWLNHSRYPSVDMATDFAKEHYAGVYKSFYDFASRYYGIDNLLAGSVVNPSSFKSMHAYALVISDRMLEFKSDGTKMSELF